ncbi:alpha/beta fold hydrolase [Qipengyuania atrilutea]|uniref:Palmitoyl-protein thioesterase ABHD10, mitochondrial n=1 Tax=Qipengyuania atrilutea TaxID=2744473 RepID=A0A850GY88_9SPHN|nr:alpha/beta hydrolase [Actirhodobacter atriluteus]NVD44584.1 alpha/beta hydrolase [Actirhodobacter atriluteus]
MTTEIAPPQFHTMSDGRRIAYRSSASNGPTIVFLPGYMSDMDGGKATAIASWAKKRRHGTLLLDYSGCGHSDGDFADGTLTQWRDEVLELTDAYAKGPLLLVGSSMGGWLMLLVALAMKDRLVGMIGIAPAPDFSDWGFDEGQKWALAEGKTVYEDNPYGPAPTPTHGKFWQDAETHRLLDGSIDLACPVHLIHGQQDNDVPWQVSVRLAEALRSEQVQVTLVKSGTHRLSRPEDIALLLSGIAAISQAAARETP